MKTLLSKVGSHTNSPTISRLIWNSKGVELEYLDDFDHFSEQQNRYSYLLYGKTFKERFREYGKRASSGRNCPIAAQKYRKWRNGKSWDELGLPYIPQNRKEIL